MNLYAAGYSLQEIGKLFGFDAEAIRKKLIEKAYRREVLGSDYEYSHIN